MIVDLPDTTTTELSKRLVKIRSEVGAMARAVAVFRTVLGAGTTSLRQPQGGR